MQTNHSTPSGRPSQRWIFPAVGLLALVGAVAIFTLSGTQYFSDPLTGPRSPKLSIPSGKYGYTPQGLRRNQSDNAVDRPVVKTVSGAYLKTTRFTAELKVTMAEDDLAYFGLGQGSDNPAYSNEKSNCFLFRIHNIGSSGIGVAATRMGGPNGFLDLRVIGAYVPGTTEIFRIVRDGDYVTFSIPSQNASQTYSISQYRAQLGLTDENTYLFFGNTGVGTVFSDLRVTPTAAANDNASPGRR